MTPEQFATGTKAWIEAASAILDVLIVKLGILIVAGFGLLKTFRTQDSALRNEIDEVKARQDRQSNRIDAVAMAVPGTGNGGEPQEVKVINTPGDPVQVTTEETTL